MISGSYRIGDPKVSSRAPRTGRARPADLQLARHPFLQVRQELQAHGACREIALELLSCGDIEQYLRLQFPEHSFPDHLASSIHASTEGNSLFMVDLLRTSPIGASSHRRIDDGL